MRQIIFLKSIFITSIIVMFSACGSNSRAINENNETVKKPIITSDNSAQVVNSNKKIFLIGDSTVNNPTDIGVGWGDQISQYMVHSQNLFNLAQSGTSSKSYKESNDDDWYNDLPKTKRIIKSENLDNGGYLLIQFGHNDETDEADEVDMKTYPGVGNSFYNELKEYIVYARGVGLTPVLITPVERMEKVAGYQLNYTHIKKEGDYAQTVRDLSQDEDVLLLDLQDKSWKHFNTYRDKQELIETFGYADNTHFDLYGAKVVASWVKELICDSGDREFCSQFK